MINNSFQRSLWLILCVALMTVPISTAFAAPADIVSPGSAILDAFVVLSKTDRLVGKQYTTSDFLGSRLYSRGELAQILADNVLSDPNALKSAQQNPQTAAALRAALIVLSPELKLDGYDADKIARSTPISDASADLMVRLEARAVGDTGRNQSTQLDSGVFGIYRGTVQGDISSSARYVVSTSNQPEDYRRVYDNDLGPHDFSALQEAYIELHNNHGLRFDFGRKEDRWGPGYRGATSLGDNSPPFNQLELSFPFSLGQHLGRNYTYDQMATIYDEFGTRRYQETRRIGYQFSKQWQADAQEGFKSTDSTSLAYTPLPFDVGQGIRLNTAQYTFNYQLNLGLTYSPATTSRVYGQFFVDDIKGPFTSGHVLGLNIGNHDFVPRKIAYLIGAHTETKRHTALTLEYDTSDPNTYTYRNQDGIWQHGNFNWIGLPDGPDSQEVYARIDQRIGKPLTLSLEYRDRWRHENSWIAPTAREVSAEGSYRFTNRDSAGLAYRYYRQDPYPYAPNTPDGAYVNPYAPVSEGQFGQYLRASELDFSYQHIF